MNKVEIGFCIFMMLLIFGAMAMVFFFPSKLNKPLEERFLLPGSFNGENDLFLKDPHVYVDNGYKVVPRITRAVAVKTEDTAKIIFYNSIEDDPISPPEFQPSGTKRNDLYFTRPYFYIQKSHGEIRSYRVRGVSIDINRDPARVVLFIYPPKDSGLFGLGL